MTTEQELREVLAAHADDAPDNSGRLAQVRAGVRTATDRRRRTGVLLAALAVLAVTVPVVTHHPSRPVAHGDFLTPGELASSAPPDPAAATPTPMIVNPEYAGGGRRIGAGAATSPAHGTLTYTFTPTTYDLYLTSACTDDQTSLSMAVNGHLLGFGSCGGGSGDVADPVGSRQQWGSYVHLGRLNTVTVTIIAGTDGVGVHPLSASLRRPGTVASAIYQGVPFDDYPLPPRPATPTPLDAPGTGLLRATASGDGSVATTFVVGAQLEVYAVAPGLMTVLIAGHHATTYGSYVWTGFSGGLDVSPTGLASIGVRAVVGQRLTVTVVTSHFTGPYWELIS